jgi:tRNA (Thr-GGU) A37 N-methylase
MKNPFDLVIFDCDGVLVESEPLANQVYVQLFGEFGYQLDYEETLHEFQGVTIHDRLAASARKFNITPPADFIPAFNQRLAALTETELKVVPGVRDFIYYFHLVEDARIETGSRHPRNNIDWPKVGIFSQRGKNRPNRLGATIVKILKPDGRQLHVQGLDAIDSTPVLDIKPVMQEFLPREKVHQPEWATELMKQYW